MKHSSKDNIRFAVVSIDAACFRVVNRELFVLLGKVNLPPHFTDHWGLIGGMVRPDETTDDALKRHLSAKANIKNIYHEQLYTFSGINRDPRGRVIAVAYLALSGEDPQEGGEGSVPTKWFPVEDLPRLAYDHKEIIETGIERLQARIGYTNIAQHLLPKEFTLTELQETYESILKKKLDKRNFRKKVLAVKLIKETGKKKREGATRPAALYRFSSKGVTVVEIL